MAVNDAVTTNEDTPAVIAVLTNDSDVEVGVLTPTIVVGPAHGALVANANGTFTYTPNANFNGTDTFTYSVSDGAAQSGVATVAITVTPVGDAPIAIDDAVITAEDTGITFSALGNDIDVDGNGVMPDLTSLPSHGDVVLNGDGTFTYTPTANFTGTDSFTYLAYSVADGTLMSNSATVTITVTPVNDVPLVSDISRAVDEDGVLLLDLLSDASDVDGDTLSVSSVAQPTHGYIGVDGAGVYRYYPPANFYGVETISFAVTDGIATKTATLTITIRPINDPPTAVNDSAVTAEDQPIVLNVLLNDSDVENDALTPSVVTGPSHGTLVLNGNGTFTYTPVANFNGADQFTYRVSDGQAVSNVATVSITVTPVNDAPVAADASVLTMEDMAATFDVRLSNSDVDGDSLTPVVVNGPAHGIVTLQPNGAFTYTPDANFNGTDQFQYRLNDGSALSNLAQVTIYIVAMNDAPTVSNGAVTGTEDRPYVFTWSDFHANDVDSTSLSVVVTSLPADGQLQWFNGTTWMAVTAGQVISKNDIDAGFFCFGPDANESGFDGYATAGVGNRAQDYARFTYRVRDEQLSSSEALMAVDLTPVADTPLLTFGNANGGIGGASEVWRTTWESAPNRNLNSTVLPQATLEGWAAVMPPGDSNNHFIVWSSGDQMKDAGNTNRTVYAATSDGNNWIELANANGAGHETIGISRSVTTRSGTTYLLNFDYAGRLGYSVNFTKIGVYVDGTKIGEYASTSPNTALNWQALSFSFVGNGAAQTIRIQIESATDSNGRGAMIDDISLAEQQPFNSGYANSAIHLSSVAAALVDTDGSETLSLSMSAIPVGATLTDGVRSFTATTGNTSVNLAAWTLNNLSITPPTNYTGTFDLVVTASATEAVTGGTAGTVANLRVTVLTQVSPLVLDLGGDGVRTLSLEESTGKFDLLNTGHSIDSGWLSPEDGFLAIDTNHNGRVDDRSELFGGGLGEGFARLATFDTNHDGQVNAQDLQFNDLLVWQDRNGNHRTDAGELRSLIDAGVASLSISYTFKPEEQKGNWLYEQGSAILANGASIAMVDAYFQTRSELDSFPIGNGKRNGLRDARIVIESDLPARNPAHSAAVRSQSELDRMHKASASISNPVIEWMPGKRAPSIDKHSVQKAVHRNAWLHEFLGAKREQQQDLGQLIGLHVTLPRDPERSKRL